MLCRRRRPSCSTHTRTPKIILPPFYCILLNCSCVSSSAAVDWGETGAIHHHPVGWHADPAPGLQPNTDMHRISWAVRLNREPRCSKENTDSEHIKEGICNRAVEKWRGIYLLFTSQWQKLNGPFPPADVVCLWNVIQHVDRGSLEKVWALSGRQIREQSQICCSLISPIYHCLLRSATEPPGCKLQHQRWFVCCWNQTQSRRAATGGG